jgi:zinc/manganese transport system permease protein
VTPAAIAERLSTHPPMVILLSVLLAVIFTWAGLLTAFYFPYPVSFFITSFAFLAYIIVRVLPVTQEGTIALIKSKKQVVAHLRML